MKTSIFTLILIAFISAGYAQPAKLELTERRTPTAREDKLKDAKYITDLSPYLWEHLDLASKERYFLIQRRVNIFPQIEKFDYQQEKYKEIVDYVAVELSTTNNGRTLIASSNSDLLTAEQKNLLTNAQLGAVFNVKIKYKYKDTKEDGFGPRDYVVEGNTTITVAPAIEAAYPGGFKNLSEYFTGNVINKAPVKNSFDLLLRAIVTFTVDENGKVLNPKLNRTSTNVQVDKLILDAITQMPNWKPAQNSKGIKVKQEVCIPFNSGGC